LVYQESSNYPELSNKLLGVIHTCGKSD